MPSANFGFEITLDIDIAKACPANRLLIEPRVFIRLADGLLLNLLSELVSAMIPFVEDPRTAEKLKADELGRV